MKFQRDIDNYFKSLLDALEHNNIIKNDKYVI